MAGMTNRGKYWLLDVAFPDATEPTNFYIALYTGAAAPGPDTNVHGDLTQIAPGNGYADGGYQLARNVTDFDVQTEDDTNDRALIQIKDVSWTASGGNIPSSGDGARYAAITDDNATIANRQVFDWWDLVSDRTVSDGQTLTLQDLEIRITE